MEIRVTRLISLTVRVVSFPHMAHLLVLSIIRIRSSIVLKGFTSSNFFHLPNKIAADPMSRHARVRI